MKLCKVQIENFGKLSDFTWEFTPGCNEILKENGWGKSTLIAFLRVMFYGFENERKTKITENERKKYKPWQSGVYGGRIEFEANGKCYRVERTFGDRGDDSFALFDAQTNLSSTDYTDNLGEELFGVDSESFRKSVYMAQQQIPAEITPGIQAKIGNVSDAMEDLGGYDLAEKRLKDEANRLTPRRKTGELKKEKEELAKLDVALAGKASLVQARETQEHSITDLQRKLRENETQKKELVVLQDTVSRYHAKKATIEHYQDLRENEAKRKEELIEEALPTEEAIRVQTATWEKRGKRLSEMQTATFRLEAAESNLARLEKEYEVLSQQEIDVRKADTPQEKTGLSIPGLLLLVAGALGMAIAAILLISGQAAGLFGENGALISIVGIELPCAMLLLVGLAMVGSSLRKRASVTLENEARERMEQEAAAKKVAELQALQSQISACRQEAAAWKKQIETQQTECSDMEAEMQTFLETYHLPYDAEHVSDALYQLLERRTKQNHQKTIWEEAKAQREAFEAEHASEELQNLEEAPTQSLEEIQAKLSGLQKESDEIAEEVRRLRDRMDDLDEQLDDISEKEEAREALAERMKVLRYRYDIVEQTRTLLEDAKNRFCGRYMEPIREGFEKYYNMLSEQDGMEYQFDAQLGLTTVDFGTTHSTELLSEGYRDLVGLCRRLAMVDSMYEGEKPPLILDDPFVNFDDAKLDGCRAFLDGVAQEYQVIYLTCHQSRTMQ